MNKKPHCSDCCPLRLNREKQLAIAKHALATIRTPEAVQALQSMAVLDELHEIPSCETCEVTA